jgi:hypothetical protein
MFGIFLVLAVVACSTRASEETVPLGAATTSVDSRPISIELSLPQAVDGLVGDAPGRVLNAAGETVATFAFASGWLIPPDYSEGKAAEATGAPLFLTVELPSPGRYVFEVDAYFFSGRPCGTCETGFGPTKIEVEVVDGSTVEMPRSERVSES